MPPEDLLKVAKELVADRWASCEVRLAEDAYYVCEWRYNVGDGDVRVVVSAEKKTLRDEGRVRWITPNRVIIIHQIGRAQRLLHFTHPNTYYWSIGCNQQRQHLSLLINQLQIRDARVAG